MSTIIITGNVLSNSYKDYSKAQMNTYFEGFIKDYEISQEQNYYVKEFEVYSLKFN